MTLGEFAAAVRHDVYVKIELRNTKNKDICTCKDNSPVMGVYENCELIDWCLAFNYGRVVVHIDDSEVLRRLEREGCL